MEKYDIAIIGTGPAGVSAALTAKNRNKKILLFGSREISQKVKKSHLIENYPGLPSITGEDLAKTFLSHLDARGIPVTEERVSAVYAMGSEFAIQAGENMYTASAVILASGVVMGKTLPGEEENLGRGVSYCATCDATLYHGKTSAVIGYAPKEEAEAAFLAEVAAKVFYFPQYPEEPEGLPENVEILREKPKEIHLQNPSNPTEGVCLRTESGNEYVTNGVFVLRESIAPSRLVPGLETDGAHIVTGRNMATNIAGCFAAGDITGQPYQDAKAVGEGNVAALSAAAYLDEQKRKEGSR
ncbi:MAG: NAD(P)/FAD-dependent oxidoreductase [Eubacteriales bacterium]|nr:NAD(P)/FAD-dependent oxidoreductase [Eubacteriales bacterium]